MKYLVPLLAPLAVGAILAGLLLPCPASAQTRPELRITPRAGLLTPADWFYVEFPSFGAGPMEWTEAAILRTPIVGVAAELAFESAGLWLRAEGLRTVGGRTAIIHAYLHPASQAGPGIVLRTRWDVPSTVTVGTLDAGLPLRLRLPFGIQPYVTAGVGGKHYGFDLSILEEYDARIVRPSPGTVPVLNVGGGAVVSFRGWHLDLAVRDAISEYWGVQQHDVVFLAGLRVRAW
jgi:hypothetical protein